MQRILLSFKTNERFLLTHSCIQPRLACRKKIIVKRTTFYTIRPSESIQKISSACMIWQCASVIYENNKKPCKCWMYSCVAQKNIVSRCLPHQSYFHSIVVYKNYFLSCIPNLYKYVNHIGTSHQSKSKHTSLRSSRTLKQVFCHNPRNCHKYS